MTTKDTKIGFGIVAFLLASSGPARADLFATLNALPAYQVGTGAFVSFGTVVDARTNINAIWAGGTYRLECEDPHIRPALTGSRSWSDNGIIGPRQITVTVPAWVPATQALPGWQSVMGGTFFNCVYTHSGAAKTNFLPIGSSGTTIQIGGDYWDEAESIVFGVIKPGTSFGGGCIF
jgi:hypothetical protein